MSISVRDFCHVIVSRLRRHAAIGQRDKSAKLSVNAFAKHSKREMYAIDQVMASYSKAIPASEDRHDMIIKEIDPFILSSDSPPSQQCSRCSSIYGDEPRERYSPARLRRASSKTSCASEQPIGWDCLMSKRDQELIKELEQRNESLAHDNKLLFSSNRVAEHKLERLVQNLKEMKEEKTILECHLEEQNQEWESRCHIADEQKQSIEALLGEQRQADDAIIARLTEDMLEALQASDVRGEQIARLSAQVEASEAEIEFLRQALEEERKAKRKLQTDYLEMYRLDQEREEQTLRRQSSRSTFFGSCLNSATSHCSKDGYDVFNDDFMRYRRVCGQVLPPQSPQAARYWQRSRFLGFARLRG
jgi:hypothetical protein